MISWGESLFWSLLQALWCSKPSGRTLTRCSHELDPLTNGKVAERGLDARFLLVTPTQVERRQKENLIRVHLFFYQVISHLLSSKHLRQFNTFKKQIQTESGLNECPGWEEERTAADTARGKCSLSGHSCRGGAAVSGRHFHNTTLRLTHHSNNPTVLSLDSVLFKMYEHNLLDLFKESLFPFHVLDSSVSFLHIPLEMLTTITSIIVFFIWLHFSFE